MKTKIARRSFGALGLAGLLPATAGAQQDYPSRAITMLVGFAPGGGTDIISRFLQPFLQDEFRQTIAVENRPGASGALGSQAAARAVGDGNTWVTVFDTHAVNPFLIPNLGFDTERDFAPIMLIGTAPMIITTHNSRPWQNLRDVIATAREKPDTVTYGSIGNGSLSHLTMTLMQRAGDFRVVHVPYRGGGPMSAAAAAGELDMPMATNAGLGGQVGRTLRPLAQTGAKRSALFPDLPTVAEQGLPGIDALAWWGLLAPARVPEPIQRRFHAALVKALAEPELRARMTGPLGIDVIGSTPEEFGAFLQAQMALWGRVVRENNIRSD